MGSVNFDGKILVSFWLPFPRKIETPEVIVMTDLQRQTDELYGKLTDCQSELEERLMKVDILTQSIQQLAQEKHDLEREIADAERRKRTRLLIQIGAEYVRVFHSFDVAKAREFFDGFTQEN